MPDGFGFIPDHLDHHRLGVDHDAIGGIQVVSEGYLVLADFLPSRDGWMIIDSRGHGSVVGAPVMGY